MATKVDFNNKDLAKIVRNQKKKDKDRKKKMSKEEEFNHIIAWTTYYRRNIHIFVEDYLEIKLKIFQKFMLYILSTSDIIYFIMSRGSGKTFLTGVYAIAMALLYPNSEIRIASLTLAQSNKLITEKIERELCGDSGFSTVLRELRRIGYITFTTSKENGGRIVNIANGSQISAEVCGKQARGIRTTILIIDEARLVKKSIISKVFLPQLRPRVYPAILKEEYQGREEFIDNAKQIYLSSARYKSDWLWTSLKEAITQMYHHRTINYGVLGVDMVTAIAENLKGKNQLEIDRREMGDSDFEMEDLNIWLGESDDALFSYDDFYKNQELEEAFYPLDDYGMTSIEFSEKGEDEIRIMSVDIAVSGGKQNDNTVFVLGSFDSETFEKKANYVRAINGMNANRQVIAIKKTFQEFQGDYVIMDAKGVGTVLYDMLTEITIDPETLEEYPAWTVTRNPFLQISSDTVMQDKIDRTLYDDSLQVIVPFVGTAELNSVIHLSLRQSLRQSKIKFLKDDKEMEMLFGEKDKNWLLKPAEDRAKLLLPYVETRLMINEAVGLKTIIKEGKVKVVEEGSATKDRYMTLAMFDFLCEKIKLEYSKGAISTTTSVEDWSFLKGVPYR